MPNANKKTSLLTYILVSKQRKGWEENLGGGGLSAPSDLTAFLQSNSDRRRARSGRYLYCYNLCLLSCRCVLVSVCYITSTSKPGAWSLLKLSILLAKSTWQREWQSSSQHRTETVFASMIVSLMIVKWSKRGQICETTATWHSPPHLLVRIWTNKPNAANRRIKFS